MHDNLETIANLAAAHGKPQTSPHPNGVPYAVVPSGYVVKELPTSSTPPRPIGTVKFNDADSFCRWFNEHAVRESRVYIDMPRSGAAAACVAVIDDFDLNTIESAVDATTFDASTNTVAQALPPRRVNVDEQVGWRQFRAEYQAALSPEWLAWCGIDRKPKSQKDFAEFLLDQLPDIAQPDGATIMDLVNNFEASIGGTFMSQQRLQSGDVAITIKKDTAGATTVRLPEHITLSPPIFDRGQPQQVTARLRYNVSTESGLAFRIELVRPHKVIEAALADMRAAIERTTSRPAFIGKP